MRTHDRTTLLVLIALLLAIQIPALADEVNADSKQRVTKIRPLLGEAEKAARKWKGDAVLVAINVKAEAAGTVDLKRLAAPPRFEGGLVTVTYRSISGAQVLTLMRFGLRASGLHGRQFHSGLY